MTNTSSERVTKGEERQICRKSKNEIVKMNGFEGERITNLLSHKLSPHEQNDQLPMGDRFVIFIQNINTPSDRLTKGKE